MTLLFESFFPLQTLFGFLEYDSDGYPIEDEHAEIEEEEEREEDTDDGFDDEKIEDSTGDEKDGE